MKIKAWYPVLIVSLCVLSLAMIYGCGNPTGGGGGGGGGGGTPASGRVVDPAIMNAIVFIDVDGNGIYDVLVTGEQIATTDARGYFTFTKTPSVGATIKILVQGLHLGITYDAVLTRPVDGKTGQFVTPLTTMLSNGISTSEIIDILEEYAAITIEPEDITADPLAGFNPADPSASIAKLRGAICAYCLMQVISNETGVYGGYFDKASIEGVTNVENGLRQMGAAVRGALPDDMVIRINGIITSIETEVKKHTGPLDVHIPPAKVDDVASTAFVITKWIMKHAILTGAGGGYSPGPAPLLSIEAYAGKIGLREYLLRNRTAVIFRIDVDGAPLPKGSYTYEYLVDHNMMYEGPGGGTLVATGEIGATVEGYTISFPTLDPNIIRVY